MEKYAHRRYVILGIIKAHYSIGRIGPSNGNFGYINAIPMVPLMRDQYEGAIITIL